MKEIILKNNENLSDKLKITPNSKDLLSFKKSIDLLTKELKIKRKLILFGRI